MDGYVYLARDKHGALLIWSSLYSSPQEAVDRTPVLQGNAAWSLHRVAEVPPAEVPPPSVVEGEER